ncbi:unnamed protein product [Linum trigynum]|uniref:Uncharacterized protein n=1 Tax=Linum trigynum TaxID=586398 RepID=A0AAV2FWC6_9ROSI
MEPKSTEPAELQTEKDKRWNLWNDEAAPRAQSHLCHVHKNLRKSPADIGQMQMLKILRAEKANTSNGYLQVEVLAGIKLPTSLKVLTTSSAVANLAELLELRELKLDRCKSRIV